MHPVTKAAGSNPAAHVLPRFFLDFSEPFGPMNFHSWVILYCKSISTKDKAHFLWIFPTGKSRFCYDSFQKSTRKYTGGVTYSNYHGLFVVFLVASPADWIFARILQFFITACYGGHAPKFPTGNLGTAFPLQVHLKCCNDAGLAGCWL
jgi:hypothetical protein